jgi:hypothetical protein
MLMTENTVFQDRLCNALPMAMNGTDAPAKTPTNAKKAICDNERTNFIVIHIAGFNQSNCARNEKMALLTKTFRLFMLPP